MKFYSEITKKFYDSEKACSAAEKDYYKAKENAEVEKRKAAELRKARANEVEQARKEYFDARKKYSDVLTKFCNDYGSYHCSIKDPQTVSEFLDTFFHLI